MIGLGLSASGNITADVIVVRSFDELDALNPALIIGKIVCFNQPWTNYDETVLYRSQGTSRASSYGALGVLLKSVASFSINSPHTVQFIHNIRVKLSMIQDMQKFLQLL